MSGSRYDSAAGRNGRAGDRWQAWDDSGESGAVAGLGQMIAGHLFAAGLDLQSALALIGEGPAADRCARALAELDDMLRQVRHRALGARKRQATGSHPMGAMSRPASRNGHG